MKRVFILLIICMTSHVIAFAQKVPKFTVEVSSDSILLGNYFVVKFTLENANIDDFQAPDFGDFNLVSGPNVSSSMSVINGEVSQKASYIYYLEPRDIGNFYIQPASVNTGEEVLETTPLEVLVVPNPEGIIQKPQMQEHFNFDLRMDNFFAPPQMPEKELEKPKRKTRKTYKL